MLKLDDNLLQEIGLGALPEDQKKAMLQHIYETLELRVGTQLANQMTDQQLDEFEQFIDSGGDANQAQALQWLESNLPNYKDVVNAVFESLKGEVKQMAPQIMASAQQQPEMPQQTIPQAQQQQFTGGPNGYQPPQQPQQSSPSYQMPPQQQPSYTQPQQTYAQQPQSYQAPQTDYSQAQQYSTQPLQQGVTTSSPQQTTVQTQSGNPTANFQITDDSLLPQPKQQQSGQFPGQ
jgi:hypothetical protein